MVYSVHMAYAVDMVYNVVLVYTIDMVYTVDIGSRRSGPRLAIGAPGPISPGPQSPPDRTMAAIWAPGPQSPRTLATSCTSFLPGCSCSRAPDLRVARSHATDLRIPRMGLDC